MLRSDLRKTLGMALTGPMPMISGGTPATEYPRKRPMGVRLKRLSALLATTTAPAPSDICELLPAVTDPLAANTGFSFERLPSVPGRGPSSRSRCRHVADFVGGKIGSVLLNGIGCNFLPEFAASMALSALCVAGHCEFVLCFAAHLPAFRDFFPCYTHAIRNADVLIVLKYRRVERHLVPRHGTMLMLSVPDATITSALPRRIRSAASATA